MKTKDVSNAWSLDRWDKDLQFKTIYRNSNAVTKTKGILPRLMPLGHGVWL